MTQLVNNNFHVRAAVSPTAEKPTLEYFRTDDFLKGAIQKKTLELIEVQNEHDPKILQKLLEGCEYAFVLPVSLGHQQSSNDLLNKTLTCIRSEFEAFKNCKTLKKVIFSSSVGMCVFCF